MPDVSYRGVDYFAIQRCFNHSLATSTLISSFPQFYMFFMGIEIGVNESWSRIMEERGLSERDVENLKSKGGKRVIKSATNSLRHTYSR